METRQGVLYFLPLSGAPIIPRRPDEFVPWTMGNDLDVSKLRLLQRGTI